VRKLGGRRVVFGTDASGRGYGAALGKVYGARLPARVKALILGGNAARLLARRASGAPADNRPKPAAIPGGGGAGR
jgi:predicted TIM-barrel fold metal-dependent hydrolase